MINVILNKKVVFVLSVGLVLSGCAGAEVTRVSQNAMIVDAGAAPACGAKGAARVAAKSAAVETIKSGFDGYIIGGIASQNNVRTITTPGQSYTYGNYGGGTINATTYYTEDTYVVGSHDRRLYVVMFKKTDPEFKKAVDARKMLGENWEETVKNGVHNCL